MEMSEHRVVLTDLGGRPTVQRALVFLDRGRAVWSRARVDAFAGLIEGVNRSPGDAAPMWRLVVGCLARGRLERARVNVCCEGRQRADIEFPRRGITFSLAGVSPNNWAVPHNLWCAAFAFEMEG
jgi:hypothetical protein